MSRSKFALKSKPDYRLSEEAALDNLGLLLERYRIDVEKIADKTDRQNFESVLDRTVEHIRLGLVEVKITDGKFVVVQHMSGNAGTMLEYGEIGCTQKKCTDGYKSEDRYAMICALMGSLSGIGEAGIEKLKGIDMSVMECLGAIFLKV